MVNPNDRIRGHADIPLNLEGQRQVHELGQQVAKNGPFDFILSGDLSRQHETAKAIAGGAPIATTPHLRDIDYGQYTGQKTRDVISNINKSILRTPDQPIDGATGESFNNYSTRISKVLRLAINAKNEYPDARIGMVVNRRTIKTIQGWLANGKTDGNYDYKSITDADSKLQPADMFKVVGNKEGKYGVEAADPAQSMEPGLYLVRHGMTDWNGESKGTAPPIGSATHTARGINDIIKNASTSTT